SETFDLTAAGALPAGWSQWSSAAPAFAVSAARSVSAPNGLAMAAAFSNIVARAWEGDVLPADAQAGAAGYLAGLIPAQVSVRGQALDSAAPSYYAGAVTRGLQVQLQRVAGGAAAVLGQVQSADYVSGVWVRATVLANGSNVRAQVYRPDRALYLDATG